MTINWRYFTVTIITKHFLHSFVHVVVASAGKRWYNLWQFPLILHNIIRILNAIPQFRMTAYSKVKLKKKYYKEWPRSQYPHMQCILAKVSASLITVLCKCPGNLVHILHDTILSKNGLFFRLMMHI